MKLFKKFLALCKCLIVGTIWTYTYLYITLTIFKSAWNFNYLSPQSWSIISTFWNEGGRINTSGDYLFLFSLIILIPLWIWGWIKLYRTNFINVLFLPIAWYQNKKANTYLKEMSRIKLHNIGASIGAEAKQDFENKYIEIVELACYSKINNNGKAC